jgi:membrane protein
VTPSAGPSDPPPADRDGRAINDRARRRVSAVRARYQGSWVKDIVKQLQAVDFLDWTVIFGAELLWSALPFIILLSSVADTRIDDDISRHIGLDSQGAHLVRSLFRNRPAHAAFAILTGLLFAFAGIISTVNSLQKIYERVFDQEPRGWRDFPRYVIWVAVLLGLLVAEGSTNGPERSIGLVIQALVTFALATVFFVWTMHFLLAGRVPWRRLVRPSLVTAVLWVALAFFSSLYFSPTLIDDSKTYGTIGIVFTFLTWFILIGSVIVLGAASGAVWETRGGRGAFRADRSGRRNQVDDGVDGEPAPPPR